MLSVSVSPLLLVAILSSPLVASGWGVARYGVQHSGGGRRALLQSGSYENAGSANENKALLSIASGLIPAEPTDWGTPVPVRSAAELRAAICRLAVGTSNEDPELQKCVTSGVPASDQAVSISLYQDISLEGQGLPPIHGKVKISGECIDRSCNLYAVDAKCCDCQTIWLTGNTDLCSECRKGQLEASTPITVSSGAHLWLEHMDICSGRSTNRGGIAILQPGDDTAWTTGLNEGLTFLSAVDVGFSKGLTLDRGGAIGMWRGTMAVLTRPRFVQNYAALTRASSIGGASGPSHDIAVAVRSALILQDPEPSNPSIYLAQSTTDGADLDSFRDAGQYFLKVTASEPETPPIRPPPPSPASPSWYLIGDSRSDSRNSRSGAGGMFGLGGVATGAIVTALVVLLVLGMIYLVVSGKLCRMFPERHERESEDTGFYIPKETNQPDVLAIQMQDYSVVEEQRSLEARDELERQTSISRRFQKDQLPSNEVKGHRMRQARSGSQVGSGNDTDMAVQGQVPDAWCNEPPHHLASSQEHKRVINLVENNQKPNLYEGVSSSIQPIAALADLPLPDPKFGYRGHYSKDGGKSGFVVAAFRPQFMDMPAAVNYNGQTEAATQLQSSQPQEERSNLMRQLLRMNDNGMAGTSCHSDGEDTENEEEDGIELIELD